MSETSKKLSKNAKRREKAREKKLTQLVEERKKEEETTVKADPTIAIKQQLAEAKANGVYIYLLFFSCKITSTRYVSL